MASVEVESGCSTGRHTHTCLTLPCAGKCFPNASSASKKVLQSHMIISFYMENSNQVMRIFGFAGRLKWMREATSGVPEPTPNPAAPPASPRLPKEVTARETIDRWLSEQAPSSLHPPIASIQHFRREIARRDPATTGA